MSSVAYLYASKQPRIKNQAPQITFETIPFSACTMAEIQSATALHEGEAREADLTIIGSFTLNQNVHYNVRDEWRLALDRANSVSATISLIVVAIARGAPAVVFRQLLAIALATLPRSGGLQRFMTKWTIPCEDIATMIANCEEALERIRCDSRFELCIHLPSLIAASIL